MVTQCSALMLAYPRKGKFVYTYHQKSIRILVSRGFLYLCEVAGAFVDHLNDADDETSDKDWHAENGARVVARQLVHCAVKTRVRVGVSDV